MSRQETVSTGKGPGRIEFLDFAKGCAMLSIVLYHYFRGYFPGIGDKAVMVGGAGVHLFLLLSGFGLALSGKTIAPMLFYRKRFSRVLVPYYLTITLIFFINFFIPIYPSAGLYAWLGHIFFFKMFDESIINSFGGHFWFLSTIIQFYLVYPILDRLLGRMGNSRFVVSGMAVSVAYWILLALAGLESMRIWNSFFLQYLWEFCGGMVLARLYVCDRYCFWQQPLPVLLFAGLAGMGLMGAMALKGGDLGRIFNDIPSAVGYTALVAFLYGVLPSLFCLGDRLRKGLLFTGSISYELYLTHMLVFSLVALLLANGVLNNLSLIGRLLSLVLAFPVAATGNRFFVRLQSRNTHILKPLTIKMDGR